MPSDSGRVFTVENRILKYDLRDQAGNEGKIDGCFCHRPMLLFAGMCLYGHWS